MPKIESNSPDPAVGVSVYQTEELTARAGHNPEETAVAYVARAFERLGLPYRVDWDFPPVAGIPDPTRDKRGALRTWVQRVKSGGVPGLAKDANLLLTTLNGGGMANPRVGAAICPAGTLTRDYSTDLVEWVPRGDPRHPVFGILHELGHCLGSKHDLNWGRTWRDDAERAWYRTPTAFAGTVNVQGEGQAPQPAGYEKRDWLSFAADAGPHLRLRPGGGGAARGR